MGLGCLGAHNSCTLTRMHAESLGLELLGASALLLQNDLFVALAIEIDGDAILACFCEP